MYVYMYILISIFVQADMHKYVGRYVCNVMYVCRLAYIYRYKYVYIMYACMCTYYAGKNPYVCMCVVRHV